MSNHIKQIKLPNETVYDIQASKLVTPRAISLGGDVTGTATFDGSSDAAITTTVKRTVGYGTCATAAATAAKVATIADTSWVLEPGSVIGIKFTYSNTASSCTLNVNNTGAKSIWYNNAAYTGSSNSICGYASRIVFYMYDGTYWVWLNMGTLDGNTDTKVQQNAAITTAGEYPVILAYSTATSKVTNAVQKTSTLTYNPNTQILTAPTFKGNLSGNAATATSATTATSANSATKATNDGSDRNIVNTYETKGDASNKLTEAKTYADAVGTQVKNDLLNGAGAAYDTLKELGDLINDNQEAIDALETIATGKVSKSGDTMVDGATLKFSTYGNRYVTISGNSIAADMSNVDGGWAGAFASVKHRDSSAESGTATTTMLGWYGGASGLTHIFMGGTYSDPAMKMTPAGNFTFKNTVAASISGNAATATTASKVGKTMTVKLNGGTTEGTNLFTFNGSAAKSINITPASIGATTEAYVNSAIASSITAVLNASY